MKKQIDGATVQSLTAEVRILMVGSRQVTVLAGLK
jgi:hypothetical protein